MRVKIDGSGNVTGYDDTATSGTIVEFPGNPGQYSNFPTGYTVTGSAPNRKLVAPAQGAVSGMIGSVPTQVVAVELTINSGNSGLDSATQAELDAVNAAETAALNAHNTNAGAHSNLPYAPVADPRLSINPLSEFKGLDIPVDRVLATGRWW